MFKHSLLPLTVAAVIWRRPVWPPLRRFLTARARTFSRKSAASVTHRNR